MSNKYKVVVSGYMGTNQIIKVENIPQIGTTELVKNPDNTVRYPGGNGLNVTYCLEKLGVKTLYIMRTGCDTEQIGFNEFLRKGGISFDAVTHIENEATPICYLIEDSKKDHLTLFYTGAMDEKYAPKELPDRYFTGTELAVMVVGAYADNVVFLESVKKHKLPLAFGMRADFDAFPKEFLKEALEEAKIIFVNEIEKELIEQLYELDSITRFFETGKAEIIVATFGKNGSEVFWKADGKVTGEWVAVTGGNEAVDATGAGDSYISGFLYGYLKGNPPVVCAEYGSTVSSFIVEKVGCLTNVPDEAKMLERNATRKPRREKA